MPNKTVTADPDDLGDVNESVIATYDRAHPPYLGEHVEIRCAYKITDNEDMSELVISRTGAVTNMNHEHITCLVRLEDPFPSSEAIDKLALTFPKVSPAEESKVEVQPTSTNERPVASEVTPNKRRQKV